MQSKLILTEDHLQKLADMGWVTIDALIPGEILLEIKNQALQAWKDGQFTAAKIGRGLEQQRTQQIRGDLIHWLKNPEPPISTLLQDLQTQLNKELWLGINQFEVHFARYDKNTGYEAHIDQSSRSNPLLGERLISFILYLNENWQKSHAGELCIHGDSAVLIEPIWGRIALFKSKDTLHSVMPSQNERWSLTGWFRKL